jgi:hypothetical protein
MAKPSNKLDKTYRGNRALTRYEFAALLNVCIARINELLTEGTADLVSLVGVRVLNPCDACSLR